jgi:D-sedoheptulose 7-phosphate isomerase
MKFEDFAKNYLNDINKLVSSVPVKDLEKAIDIIKKTYIKNKKIILMGNGGSASTASHITCDLSKCTIRPGKPRLKVFCIVDNVPLITAWANDTSYENIFYEQLMNILDKGDLVIAFSGSGNSLNVLKAIEYANKAGAMTIGISGFNGGKLATIAQHNLIVNSTNMQHIEDLHLIMAQIIFSFLRDEVIIPNDKR